jgi:hypothetical protein
MDRLDDLLLEWEDRRAAGRPATPEELCPDDPALWSTLASRIRLLEQFDRLLTTAPVGPAPPRDPVPARIGKYLVRGELGGGGMGVVYDGWDPALGRRVAVKVIHPHLAALSGGRAVDRFRQEWQALGRLKHPNIVGVYDAGEDAGRPYLAMEYVPGGTAADHRVRLTAAGPRAVVPLVEKVARAVEAAHRRGVLHRDLKPANVLLGDGDEPLVADFGLARLAAGDGPGPGRPADPAADTTPDEVAALTTAGGPAPGTPPYMAPEQFDPAFGPVGRSADIWALGVILYELLAGRRPFPGPARDDYRRQVTGEPAPPLRGVGRRPAAVVGKCLEKNPARRFRSVGELADALAATRGVSRRAVLAGGLGAGLAGGVGYWWWGRSPAAVSDDEFNGYTDPAATRAALARLERGEAVTLIDGGPPASYRLNLGPSSGRPATWNGGWLVHAGNDYCVCELLPRLPPGDWVVEADLRQEVVQPSWTVGAFVGCTRGSTPAGPEALCYAVTLFQPGPTRRFVPNLVWARHSNTFPYPTSEFYLAPDRPAPPPWDSPVRLEFEVTADEIRPRLAGEALRPCSARAFGAYRDTLVETQPPKHPPPPGMVARFGGGVGLYVRFAAAWCGRFAVRPARPAA